MDWARGFDDFRDCRDVEVNMCRRVGDIPGSDEDGTKDFRLISFLSNHILVTM